MSESKATKKWAAILEENGCMIIPLVAGMRQRAGLPDRFVSHRRLPSAGAWIEIKNERRKATKLQEFTLIDLLAHGQTAFVLRLDPQGRAMSTESPERDVLTMRKPGQLESELDFLERSCVEAREWYELRQTKLKAKKKNKESRDET